MSISKSQSHEILLPYSRKDTLITIDNLSTAIRTTEHKKSSVSSVKNSEFTFEINEEPDSSISAKSGIKNIRFKIKDEFQNEDSLNESVENETKVMYRDEGQRNSAGLQSPSKLPHEMSDLSGIKRESQYEIRKQFHKSLMDADISQCKSPTNQKGIILLL